MDEVKIVRRATLKLLISASTIVVSGCLGPPVLERQVLGYDEVRTLDEGSCFSTSPASPTTSPFTSRRPRALPQRSTGQRRWVPAVRSRSREREQTSLTSTSVGARRRIRRSASLPFR